MSIDIPVIDVFAGPGGLGEGFSQFTVPDGNHPFKIRVSIEKDIYAHQTLELRSFFRHFGKHDAPGDYYDYLRGKVSRDKLFEKWEIQAAAARCEAKLAELGTDQDETIYEYIEEVLYEGKEWVLIGGPPCQLYSVIGRARLSQMDRQEFEKDKRHTLYEEYLKPLVLV